jgi:hypothetical protein
MGLSWPHVWAVADVFLALQAFIETLSEGRDRGRGPKVPDELAPVHLLAKVYTSGRLASVVVDLFGDVAFHGL